MKIYRVVLFFAISCQAAQHSMEQLQAPIPEDTTDIASFHTTRKEQTQYFFTHIPTSNLPESLLNELHRVFDPLIALLSPLKNETAQQRHQEVFDHVQKFYGLLYLLTKEEHSNPEAVLTAQDLKYSSVWQEYSKMTIAQSYTQETNLLKTIHEQEKSLFDYLPQFELSYYQKQAKDLRKSLELTRLFLIMLDKKRTELFNDINPQDPWYQFKTDNKGLFTALQELQKTDNYQINERFESLDWQQTAPLYFKDKDGNPQTIATLLAQNYSFETFFTQKNSEYEITPHFALFLEHDTADKTVVLTALGNLAFTGNVTYNAIQTDDNTTVYKADLEKTAFFDLLFDTDTTPQGQAHFVPKTEYFKLLCLTALPLLYSDFSELFCTTAAPNSALLEKACSALQPSDLPLFITYKPEDVLLLEHINALQHYFVTEGAQPNTFAQNKFKNFWYSIGDAFKKAAYAVGDAFKKGWYALGDAAKYVWNQGVSLYYASCVLPAIFEGKKGSASLRASKRFQERANKNFKDAADGMSNAITDIADATKDVIDAAGTVVTKVIGLIDKRIGDDLNNIWAAVADASVDFFAGTANLLIQAENTMVKLTAQATQFVTSVVMNVLVSRDWKGIGELGKTLGKDMVESLVSNITLNVGNFTNELGKAMTGLGYVVSAIIDSVEDISALTATLFYYGWKDVSEGKKFFHDFNYVKEKIDEHRRLMSGIVTTSLLVGVTVATGGTATPLATGMLAMNTGMMAMGVVGGAQEDVNIIHKKEEERHFVHVYKDFVNNSIEEFKAFQSESLLEKTVQLQAHNNNLEHSLYYYKNFLNQTYQNEAMGQAYGLFEKAVLIGAQKSSGSNTPHTNVPFVDLGSLYGITTGRLNLWPVKAFYSYNRKTNNFAQEAVVPARTLTHSQLVDLSQATPESLWYLQKDICFIPAQEPLAADVLFKVLALDATYHIGIALTERYFDFPSALSAYFAYEKALNESKPALAEREKVNAFAHYLLHFDDLSKMAVVTQDSTHPAHFATYIHNAQDSFPTKQTNGWINDSTPFTLVPGTWYRMQARIENNSLTTTLWTVGNDAQAAQSQKSNNPASNALTKTITIAPAQPLEQNALYKGAMSVITSGAAVEYKILTPQKVIPLTYPNQTIQPLAEPVIQPARQNVNQEVAKKQAVLQKLYQQKEALQKQDKNKAATIETRITQALQAANTQKLFAPQDVQATITTTAAQAQSILEQLKNKATLSHEAVQTIEQQAMQVEKELKSLVAQVQDALLSTPQQSTSSVYSFDEVYSDYNNAFYP